MQLIVETETTLDIKQNSMSTIENIQSDKDENLHIENFKTMCNGNKDIIEVNVTENKESKQGDNEISEALANIPIGEESNEAELSNVDLSKIIGEQNSIENDDAQTNESQNFDSETELNGVNSIEKEVISKTRDEPDEDDDLEDDIISLSEEPFQIIAEPVKGNGDVAETFISEEPLESEKMDNIEETKETSVEIENNVLLVEEDDVMELVEESKNVPVHCEKFQEPIIEKSNDGIEVIDETEDSPVLNDKEADLQMKGNKENSEEIQKSLEQCENGTEKTIQEEKDDIELIDESIDFVVQTEKDTPAQHEKSELALEAATKNSPIPHEMGLELLLNTEKHEIDVTLESSDLHENESLVLKDGAAQEGEINLKSDEGKVDEIKAVCKAEDITSQCDNNNSTENNSKDETELAIEALQTVNSYEKVLDSKIAEKDEVEIIDETKTPSVQCDNKTDTPMEVEAKKTDCTNTTDEIEPIADEICQDVNIKSTETSKPDPVDKITEIDKIESPITLQDDIMEVDEVVEEPKVNTGTSDSFIEIKDKMDVEEVVEKIKTSEVTTEVKETPVKNVPVNNVVDQPVVCKLSNTLDILSDDDEEEPPKSEIPKVETSKKDPPIVDSNEKQCIDIDDDDDIMFITDDPANQSEKNVTVESKNTEVMSTIPPELKKDAETGENTVENSNNLLDKHIHDEKASPLGCEVKDSSLDTNINEKTTETKIPEPPPPLISDKFLKTAKKKLADMTRDELEEFCVLKIVESIVDRSSLGDIKNKMKIMSQGLDEYRKKILMLAKQNRDLQVVMKSIQEEQKKVDKDKAISPLKITRSVGMQVIMEKAPKKKVVQQQNKNTNTQTKNITSQGPRPQKANNQPIPVPRLVPANNPVLKSPSNPQINQMNANKNNTPNGMVKTPSSNVKAEKRPFNKIGSSNNVTVDLTDDEPPAKLPGGPKCSPAPPVRLVSPQSLIAPQRLPFTPSVNSPRKVYIPISGPQSQALRPGQTIMLRTVPASSIRPRCPPPQVTRIEPNTVRMRVPSARHPAPLPLSAKQYQPPNWKALPPAPDLKLSKVDNGIVISWKIENVAEDTYEEIASYQLYAYQETSTPPSTNLWKKIGDVKALPLPMACTLTQFMAGFKYYFAVRAVDVKSRIGPFSLPGSILLLNKSLKD